MLYYGHLVRNSLDYMPKTMLLKAIRFEGVPDIKAGGCSEFLCILNLVIVCLNVLESFYLY